MLVFPYILKIWFNPITFQENIKEILKAYYMATEFDPKWYKAWHTWALSNFEVIGFLENNADLKADEMPIEYLVTYIIHAVEGKP